MSVLVVVVVAAAETLQATAEQGVESRVFAEPMLAIRHSLLQQVVVAAAVQETPVAQMVAPGVLVALLLLALLVPPPSVLRPSQVVVHRVQIRVGVLVAQQLVRATLVPDKLVCTSMAVMALTEGQLELVRQGLASMQAVGSSQEPAVQAPP